MKIIPEQVIQQEIVQYFNYAYCLKHHMPSMIIFSVPNGIPIPIPAKERARALDLLHKTGMKNGISDLIIQGMYGRIVNVEVKTETGTQSQAQIEIEEKIRVLEGVYILVRSLLEFQQKISLHIDWLLGKI